MPTKTYQITGALVVLQNLPSDPATGQLGQVYYNTTINRPKVFDP